LNWVEFTRSAPELAALGQERLERSGLCLVGTLTAAGYPRISPIEPFIVDSELMLGMMWQSKKALDMERDPRIVVHSTVSSREGTEGDFKLWGRAVDVTDPKLRTSHADTLEAKIDWRPGEPFHLVRVDIERAGFVVFGPEPAALAWNPQQGLRHPPMASA
jgi:hypothetical protein